MVAGLVTWASGLALGIASPRAPHFKGRKQGVPELPKYMAGRERMAWSEQVLSDPGLLLLCPNLVHVLPGHQSLGKAKFRVESAAAAWCQVPLGSGTSAPDTWLQPSAPSTTFMSLGKGHLEAMLEVQGPTGCWMARTALTTCTQPMVTHGVLSEQQWTVAALSPFRGTAEQLTSSPATAQGHCVLSSHKRSVPASCCSRASSVSLTPKPGALCPPHIAALS